MPLEALTPLPSCVKLSNVTNDVLSVNVFDCISLVSLFQTALIRYKFFLNYYFDKFRFKYVLVYK